MKAVFLPGNRTAELREYSEPKPDSAEVLIRIKTFGICGSDLVLYRGLEKFGTIPGHEPCGIVQEVGQNVKNLKVGDRVLVYHIIGCGRCKFCQVNRYALCPSRKYLGFHLNGSDAELMVVPEKYCLRLPESLSFAEGTLIACNVGTAFSALRKVRVTYLSPLVVFGLGPVGLSVVALAKGMGLSVIGVDVVEPRLELARTLGAYLTINSTEEDVVKIIKDQSEKQGVENVIECSGNPVAQKEAINSLATQGKIIFVGHSKELTISPTHIILERLSLVGSWVFEIQDYEPLIKFLTDNKIPIRKIITNQFNAKDVNEAFRVFDQRNTAGKVILNWS